MFKLELAAKVTTSYVIPDLVSGMWILSGREPLEPQDPQFPARLDTNVRLVPNSSPDRQPQSSLLPLLLRMWIQTHDFRIELAQC